MAMNLYSDYIAAVHTAGDKGIVEIAKNKGNGQSPHYVRLAKYSIEQYKDVAREVIDEYHMVLAIADLQEKLAGKQLTVIAPRNATLTFRRAMGIAAKGADVEDFVKQMSSGMGQDFKFDEETGELKDCYKQLYEIMHELLTELKITLRIEKSESVLGTELVDEKGQRPSGIKAGDKLVFTHVRDAKSGHHASFAEVNNKKIFSKDDRYLSGEREVYETRSGALFVSKLANDELDTVNEDGTVVKGQTANSWHATLKIAKKLVDLSYEHLPLPKANDDFDETENDDEDLFGDSSAVA